MTAAPATLHRTRSHKRWMNEWITSSDSFYLWLKSSWGILAVWLFSLAFYNMFVTCRGPLKNAVHACASTVLKSRFARLNGFEQNFDYCSSFTLPPPSALPPHQSCVFLGNMAEVYQTPSPEQTHNNQAGKSRSLVKETKKRPSPLSASPSSSFYAA